MHGVGLFLHIMAGSIALLAGAAALYARKGGRVHVAAGNVFVPAMLAMALLGTMLATSRADPLSAVSGILAAYLVVTGWATAARKDGRLGRLEMAALPVACGCALADLAFGLRAASLPGGNFQGWPPQLYFAFAALAALAVGLDINVIVRGGVTGPRRIARHLWRMCVAAFIASGSFFMGQQKVMPEAIQGSPILPVLGTAPLVLMVFWLLRVRLAKVWRRRAGPAAAAGFSPASPEGSAPSSA